MSLCVTHRADLSYERITGAVAVNFSGPTPLLVNALRALIPLNLDAIALLAGSGIPVLGGLSYNMSLALHQMHVGHMASRAELDCQHYCSPGIPEVTFGARGPRV